MKTVTSDHPNYGELTSSRTTIDGIPGADWSTKFFMLRMKQGDSLIMQLDTNDIRNGLPTFRACRVFQLKYNETQFYPYVTPINPFSGFKTDNIITFEWKDVSAVICSMDSQWDDMVAQSEEDSEDESLINAPVSNLIN